MNLTFSQYLGANMEFGAQRFFGLPEKETVDQILTLPFENLRLSIPFSEVHPTPTTWDFSKRDYVIEEAINRKKKIHLQIGIKTTGWPEVHVPKWLSEKHPYLLQKGCQLDKDPDVRKYTLEYLAKVIERYGKHQEIVSIHIENEAFSKRLQVSNYRYISKSFWEEEVALIKKLDPLHRPMVQNIPIDTPESIRFVLKHADIIGFNIYNQINHPSPLFYWLYIQGLVKLVKHAKKPIMITEYQASTWLHGDKTPRYKFTGKRFAEGLTKIQKIAPKAIVFLWGIEQRIWRKELSYFFP